MPRDLGVLRSRGSDTRRRLLADALDSRVQRSGAQRRDQTYVAAGNADTFAPEDFDPATDDMDRFMDDLEVIIDGNVRAGAAGEADREMPEHAKISLVTKFCTDPDVRDAIRGYKRHGLNGTPWKDLLFEDVRDDLVENFGNDTPKERAVEDLLDDDFVQNARVPVFTQRMLRIYKQAGDEQDLEGANPLALRRFAKMYAAKFRPGMEGCKEPPPQKFVLAMIDRGKALKLKHVVNYAKEQDAVCWRESKELGLGGRYWPTQTEADDLDHEPAAIKKSSKNRREVNAVSQDSDSRLDHLETELHNQKGEVTKLRVDMQTGHETLRTDFDRKLTILEGKQDSTQETCSKMLDILQKQSGGEQQNTSQPAQGNWNHSNSSQQHYTGQQQHGQQQQYGRSQGNYGQTWNSNGKGAKGKGLLTGLCYGCGRRGHRVRQCPFAQQGKGGMIASVDGADKSMLEVASDIMAAVTNYDRGGIEALPLDQLHEQMDDPDGELAPSEVCSISIQVASGLIAMAGEQSNMSQHSAQVGQVTLSDGDTRHDEDEVNDTTTASSSVQPISQSVQSVQQSSTCVSVEQQPVQQSVQQSIQRTNEGLQPAKEDDAHEVKTAADQNAVWSLGLGARRTSRGWQVLQHPQKRGRAAVKEGGMEVISPLSARSAVSLCL